MKKILLYLAQKLNRIVLGNDYAIPYLEVCYKCGKGFIAIYGTFYGGEYYCNRHSRKFIQKYRVVEVYKRGEKVYTGKQYRKGWNVYISTIDNEWVFDKFLSNI